MIELKLNLIPDIDRKLWKTYVDMGFSYNNYGYRGFRDYIEKTNQGVKTSSGTCGGVILYFEKESDVTLFLLRWS